MLFDKVKKAINEKYQNPSIFGFRLIHQTRKFNSEKNSGPITNTKKRLVQAFLLFIHHK